MKSIEVKTLNNSKDNLSIVYNLRKSFYDDNSFMHNEMMEIYDKHSLHFIAFKNNTPIGKITLVLNRKLPLEEHFNIDRVLTVQDELVCEVKKFIILSNDKDEINKISLQLISVIYRYLLDNKYSKLFITITKHKEKNILMYRDLGFKDLGTYNDPIIGHLSVLYLKINSINSRRKFGLQNINNNTSNTFVQTNNYSIDIMTKIFIEYLTNNFDSKIKPKTTKKVNITNNFSEKHLVTQKLTNINHHDKLALWEIYEKSFCNLTSCAQEQMCYTKTKFHKTLANENVIKFVLYYKEKAIGCSIATNDWQEASVAYINPIFFKENYSCFAQNNKIYYVTAICIDPSFSSNIVSIKVLLRKMIDFITGDKAMVAFDVSENKNFLLPLVIRKVGQEMGKPITGQEIDSQMYWECHDIRHEFSTKNN
ncbi:hypothetical protein ACFL4D_01280 [Candidatus Margulisiibacteriota bacterium]